MMLKTRKQMKEKTCSVCKSSFIPKRMGQKVCSLFCAGAYAKAQRVKEARKIILKEIRERRKRIKTRSDFVKEAQGEVNAYIRARDAGKPCISCGTPLSFKSVGGNFDAGHYRSRGAAPHLRFDERNIYGQCKRCNRYLGGNVAAMRLGMIERIGLGAVEALEADNEPRKYTIDELIEIKRAFRKKRREIEKMKDAA